VDLRQLQYFVTVAEAGSFTRAADRLHIGQPAVSQQIALLERLLGVQLFDRTTRSVRLSAAGRTLLPEARAALAAAEQVRRVAAGIVASVELRLGSSHGLGDRLYRALDELASRAPNLTVRLTRAPQDDRLALVRSGDLDAAFVRVLTAAPGLHLEPVWTEQLIVALPQQHPLAEQEQLDWADLGALPLRLAPAANNPPFHRVVTAALRAAGVDPPAGPPFTTLQDTLAEIGSGPPTWTVFNHGAELPRVPRVVLRTLAGSAVPISLALPQGPPAPAVQALLDACRAD
jgi:DNA-binding transcriptional LysR family regulator